MKTKVAFATGTTAILVDGGFFLHRYRRAYNNGRSHDARTVAKNFYTMALQHVEGDALYRILYYDCPPLNKKAHNPITKKSIDFSKSPQAEFRHQFHSELKKLRKVALRFGHLSDRGGWLIRPAKTKALLSGKLSLDNLEESDVYYDVRQKGVDLKIGLDIASLAYKRFVGKIILDSIFSPAVVELIRAMRTTPVRISYRSPWQNGIAERWIGNCRRELLEHVVVLSERHLVRLVRLYISYYHEDRSHLGLQKDTPNQRPVTPRPSPTAKVVALPRVGGLHHRYEWREAA